MIPVVWKDGFLRKIVLTGFALILLLSVLVVLSIISVFKPIRSSGGEMKMGQRSIQLSDALMPWEGALVLMVWTAIGKKVDSNSTLNKVMSTTTGVHPVAELSMRPSGGSFFSADFFSERQLTSRYRIYRLPWPPFQLLVFHERIDLFVIKYNLLICSKTLFVVFFFWLFQYSI